MRQGIFLLGFLPVLLGCPGPVATPLDSRPDTAPIALPDTKPATLPDGSREPKPDGLPEPKADAVPVGLPDALPVSLPDVRVDLPPDLSLDSRFDAKLDAAAAKPLDAKPDAPTVPAKAGLQANIEYGTVDGVRLLLDVNVPEGEGPFPVVIVVHGGGWSSGDKAGDVKPILEALTGRFTWFSINYRLAPKYRWPACLEDVQAAIRWVKANAPAYKGAPGRIAIAGYSVGGHLGPLAANLATDGTGVHAVVGVAPNTDLVKDSERRGGLSPSLQNLMNLPITLTESTRKILAEASPITHIKPGQPPVLLLCGDADKTVPIVMCQDYLAELQKNSVPGELVAIQGGAHAIGEWTKFEPNFKLKLVEWLQRIFPPPNPNGL